MWVELAALAFLLGQYIYHKIRDQDDIPKQDHAKFRIPSSDDGDIVPLIYGRVRVRNPVQAWVSKPQFGSNGFSPSVYQCNIFYVLGIGMDDGLGTNRVHNIWLGDTKFDWRGVLPGSAPPSDVTQTGDGGFEASIWADKSTDDGEYVGLYMEFLNGKATQELVDSGGTAVTWAGLYMMDTGLVSHLPASRRAPAGQVPGFRGYMSVMLHGGDINAGSQWRIGSNGTVPGYSFECSSYQTENGYPGVGVYGRIGPDSNPMNVIYDLLKCYFGKLGMDATTYIDSDSFSDAAVTLYNESHGYSRALEEPKTADEWILEILKQIDAAMYEDPSTGKLGIKLIRSDYDPNDLPIIDKSNCSSLENFAAGSWASVPNKIKLVFTNRDDDYRDGTAAAQNMAHAVGQDGIVREEVIRMPGVTHSALAQELAARELAARSRPLMKCRAVVDRTLLTLKQGDVVRLVWEDPDINIVMRVGNVSHGTLASGRIALDLIQDYFYSYRGSFPTGGGLGGIGGTAFEELMVGLR